MLGNNYPSLSLLYNTLQLVNESVVFIDHCDLSNCYFIFFPGTVIMVQYKEYQIPSLHIIKLQDWKK